MASYSPAEQLKAGSDVLLSLLGPFGFAFEFREAATGSGGPFAWGEFARDERRLEVHFRQSLGEVRYHLGRHVARHEPYMRELGVWVDCQYPGFSSEPLSAFNALAHDLQFARDFTCGDGSTLVTAALAQKIRDDAKSESLLAAYQGQDRLVAKMRDLFKQGQYAAVLEVYLTLPSPQLLTDAELRLVQIAQRRDA